MSERKFEHKGRLALVTGELVYLKKDENGKEFKDKVEVEDFPVLTITGGKVLWRIFQIVYAESLEIVFKVFRNQRSGAQNRWIWGVAVPTVRAWMLETQGEKYTPDEVYAWLRISVLGYKPVIKDIGGEEVVTMTGKRFSAMNTKEFSEAMQLIVDVMAERDCLIPLPRESNFIHEFIKDE